MISHLVRRAYSTAQQLQELQSYQDEVASFQFPTSAKILLGTIFVLYLLHMSVIRYVYGEVIATLAMVENPTVAIPMRAADLRDSKIPSSEKEEKVLPVEEEVIFTKAKPITSNLQKAAGYLRSQAGRLGPFRGLGAFILSRCAFWTLTQVVGEIVLSVSPPSGLTGYGTAIVGTISAVLAAPLDLLWTHIVISRNAPTCYLRGLFRPSVYKRLAPATAVKTFAEQVTFVLPLALFAIYGLDQYLIEPAKFWELSQCAQRLLILKGLSLVLVSVGTAILILVPATVTLTRVQASLLPEDQETIVPCDRTFGGKLVPTSVGGNGKLGMLDAWKTFTWAARMNLLKLYAKVAFLQMGVQFLFGSLLYLALQLIMGETFNKAWVVVASQLKGGM